MQKTNIDAQLNVLACLMENPYGIQEQAEGLTVDHFPNALAMADAVLNHKLEPRGKEKQIKGMDLAELTGDDRAVDLWRYADIESYEASRKLLLKYRRSKEAEKIAVKLQKSDGEQESLMGFSEELARLSTDQIKVDPKIVTPATKLWKQVLEGKEVGHPPMPCSLSGMKKAIGGYTRGRYYLIGARPGMGKTSIILQDAYAMAEAGHAGSIFSLEMTKESLTMRMASQRCGISAEKAERNTLTEDERAKFAEALKEVGSLPINIYDEPQYFSVDQVYGRSIIDMRKDGIEWVMVDYIGLMSASTKDMTFGSNRNALLTALSNKMLALKKYDLAVICLSQLSRKVEDRPDKEPRLSDLRDSGSLEQDADCIIFPVRYSYYGMENPEDGSDTEAIFVKKNRFGDPCRFNVNWEGEFTRFSDVGESGNDNSIMQSIGNDFEGEAPF